MNQGEKQTKPLPPLKSDDEAETFVAEADLTEFDLSKLVPVCFEGQGRNEALRAAALLGAAAFERGEFTEFKDGAALTKSLAELVQRRLADDPAFAEAMKAAHVNEQEALAFIEAAFEWPKP